MTKITYNQYLKFLKNETMLLPLGTQSSDFKELDGAQEVQYKQCGYKAFCLNKRYLEPGLTQSQTSSAAT